MFEVTNVVRSKTKHYQRTKHEILSNDNTIILTGLISLSLDWLFSVIITNFILVLVA